MTHFKKGVLSGIKAFVFDSDGVLAHQKTPLPGSSELITLLNRKKFPFYIMTNSSFRDGDVKHKKYLDMGLNIHEERILGSAFVLEDYLKQNPLPSAKVWASGTPDPASFLKRLGLKKTDDIDSDGLGALILFDDDFKWNTERLAVIFNRIRREPELTVIVPNPDIIYPLREGYYYPTSGAAALWIKTLLQETGTPFDPVFFGKPYGFLYHKVFHLIKNEIPDIKPHEIAMVGDTLKSDIDGANRAGFFSILVETGNFRPGHPLGKIVPDLQTEDLTAIFSMLV